MNRAGPRPSTSPLGLGRVKTLSCGSRPHRNDPIYRRLGRTSSFLLYPIGINAGGTSRLRCVPLGSDCGHAASRIYALTASSMRATPTMLITRVRL
jgi:hypothetical protein